MGSSNVGKQSTSLESHIGSTGGGAKQNGGPRGENTLVSATIFDCVAPPPLNTISVSLLFLLFAFKLILNILMYKIHRQHSFPGR